MANYGYPNPQIMSSQYQQIQQIFPQPQGSVYSINSPLELGNVPIGSTGLSVALCLNEDVMYIKSFQNGGPVIMAYRVAPYQKEQSAPSQTAQSTSASNTEPLLEPRVAKLEQLVTDLLKSKEETKPSTGGKFDVNI